MSTWQFFSDVGNQTVNVIAAPTQQPRRLPSVSALLRKGYSKINESKNVEKKSGSPMFRIGSGKPVVIKQSSVSEASVIVGDMVSDQGQVSEGNGVFNFANSMFQTGSGKSVNISTSGLARAQQLLGLEDSQTHQALKETMQQVHAQDSNQESSHLSMKVGVADKQEKNSISSLVTPLKVWCGTSGSELLEVTPETVNSISKSSSVKFHTAVEDLYQFLVMPCSVQGVFLGT